MSSVQPTRLAVLVSGKGTNLRAMIEQGVPIAVVLAERPCEALGIAEAAGIETVLIPRKNYGYRQGIGPMDWNRLSFTLVVTQALQARQIDLIAMAGFMTILHRVFFRYFRYVLNTHPSLLPDYQGLRGEDAVSGAIADGLLMTGCTIHLCTEVTDDPRFIVARGTVPILPGDTTDTLWGRIKEREYELYPGVVIRILSGQIDLEEVFARGLSA
jgi:phosphoribosylglycinamide formyltransferase 1